MNTHQHTLNPSDFQALKQVMGDLGTVIPVFFMFGGPTLGNACLAINTDLSAWELAVHLVSNGWADDWATPEVYIGTGDPTYYWPAWSVAPEVAS